MIAAGVQQHGALLPAGAAATLETAKSVRAKAALREMADERPHGALELAGALLLDCGAVA